MARKGERRKNKGEREKEGKIKREKGERDERV